MGLIGHLTVTGVTGRLSLHVNGADRTLLTVRTGVTGRLSLHVNGADRTLLTVRTGVTGAYHFM